MTDARRASRRLAARLRRRAGLTTAVLTDQARLRTYECDGLAHYKVTPGARRAARDARQQVRRRRSGPAATPACRSWRAARAPACPAARCRTPTACSIVTVADARRSCEVDPADQRAVVEPGVINLAGDPGRRAARLLLRARPVEPADLLDRRQRRGELRRRALPEVRLHHQPRDRRSSSSTPDGRRRAARRQGAGRARLRPARRVRRARRARSASPPRSPSG